MRRTAGSRSLSVSLTHSVAVCFRFDTLSASVSPPHALCSGGWGSAFSFNSLIGKGNITLRGCSATNMPGSAVSLRRRAPSNVNTAAIRSLVVENFEATAVGMDWGSEYKGHTQGYFPVTIISDSRGVIPTKPNDLTIELNNMTVRQSNPPNAAGRPVIGCQLTGEFGEIPTPCVADELWTFAGKVVIMARNRIYLRPTYIASFSLPALSPGSPLPPLPPLCARNVARSR